MSAAVVLLVVAGSLWAVALAAALGASRRVWFVGSASSTGLGGLAALLGGAWLLFDRPAQATLGGTSTVGAVTLRAAPLAGTFVALLGLVALATAAYIPRYHRVERATAAYLAVYNLALLASLGVLVAGNVVVFLVAWESMALASYLVILRYQRQPVVASAAFWFLALSEAGFLLIVAAFALLAARTGSMDFATIAVRAPALSPGVRDAAYVLALTGFGFKAGLVPLHVWLPEAHPVAPADGSAFLSGLVVKLGVYGIMFFGFGLLGAGPAWWGLLTMGLGVLSAVLGVLYSLTERDIKRFLAYSTIENVGIIITAAGAGMTFAAYGQRTLAAFLLLAALFHVASHGVSKTLLFLEAGVVEHSTGTRDMDRLGGLIHRLPRSSVISLVGTIGIAALPPLGGFVSEWLIFQGLFQGFRIPSHLVGVLIVVAGAGLGLTSGLAVNAFVRAFGIPFLGMPRTRGAQEAQERGQPVAGPGLLAVVIAALGIGAPLMLIALATAVRRTTGVALRPTLLVDKLTVIPAHTDFSAFSPTYLAVFLIAVSVVPVGIYLAGRPRSPERAEPVWDGGILAFKPRMQYSAMTFAAPVRVTFDPLYQPSVSVVRASDDPAGRSGPVHYEAEITPIFQRYLYRPITLLIEALARLVRPIQSGDVNLYLLYVFLAILVAYLLGAI